MNTRVVRRLYFYAAAFIGLQVFAAGLRGGIALVLERIFAPTAVGSADLDVGRLSSGIALLVVGLPLWAAHWWAAQRGLAALDEQRSTLRRLYGYAVLLIAMLGILFAVRTLIRALLRSGALAPEVGELVAAVAAIIVDGAIWVYHWGVLRSDRDVAEAVGGPATLRRWYLAIVQAVSLGLASYAAADLLSQLVKLLVVPAAVGSPLVREPIASLLAGLAIWLPHHIWGQRLLREQTPLVADEAESVLRQVYAALVVTIASLASLGGLVVLLSELLLALFGGRNWADLVRDNTGALASVLVGLPLWRYHRALLASEARRSTSPARNATARRIIGYLTAAIGLMTLFFGLGGLLSTLLRMVLAPAALGGGWRDALSFNLALALVALPVFALAAAVTERRARASSEEERTLARRIYLYAALLFGIVVTIGAAVALLRIVIAAALGATSGGDVAGAARWLGYALIGGAIAAYYLSLVRRVAATREEGPALVLAVVAGDPLGARLVAAFSRDLPRTSLRRADPSDHPSLAAAISGADLLIVSLAALLDPAVAQLSAGFQGPRLVLPGQTAGYTVAGAETDEALVRDAVRWVREQEQPAPRGALEQPLPAAGG